MRTYNRSFDVVKPSLLRFSTGPSSPASPLMPPMSHTVDLPQQIMERPRISPQMPPPEEPLPWMWQCHSCRRTYRLGVTRRCLNDGHYFCMGTKSVKHGRTRVRACASEYDYERWATWQQWRQDVAKAAGPKLCNKGQGCWLHCSYPSECKWSQIHEAQSRKTALEQAGTQPPRETDPTVDDTERMDVDTEYPVEEVTTTISADCRITPPPSVVDGQGKQTTYIEEVNPSTSPLKQHYQLPTINEGEDEKIIITSTVTTTPIAIADRDGHSPNIKTSFIGQLPQVAVPAPAVMPTSTTATSHLTDPSLYVSETPSPAVPSTTTRVAKIVSLIGTGLQRNGMI